MLSLVKEGKLGLDDPINGWITGLDAKYDAVTVRMLGTVLEEVTGQKLGSVLHQHAIDRAGLKHTFFLPEEPIEGQMATQFYPSGQITNPFDPSFLWAVGGMVSSAADVVEWAWALYGSQTVLDPAQIQEMINDSVAAELLPDAAESRYGQGVMVMTFTATNSGPGYGHSGRWDGTSTDAYYFKNIRTAVVVLQNVQFWPPVVGDEAVLIGVLNALSS